MIITALEIRQKTFLKGFRGYETEEVDAFLNSLSQEWEKMVETTRELKRKCDVAEQESAKMKDMESSLFRTLRTAEEASSAIIAQAELSAANKIADAESTARAMLEDASVQSSAIIKDAELRSNNALLDLEARVASLTKQVQILEANRNKLSTELRTVAENTLQYLNTLSVNDTVAVNDYLFQESVNNIVTESNDNNTNESFFDNLDSEIEVEIEQPMVMSAVVEESIASIEENIVAEINVEEQEEKLSIPLNVEFKSTQIDEVEDEIQSIDESKFHTVVLVDKSDDEISRNPKPTAQTTYQEEEDLSFFDMIK
ncbi:MAG: hypothetical protein RLZZ175_1250 [Bacteroidota bacterium]|jgi:cell division initiation protein